MLSQKNSGTPFRYSFEGSTIVSVLTFLVFQLGGEIKNAGISSFWRNLVSRPNAFCHKWLKKDDSHYFLINSGQECSITVLFR